MPESSFQLRNDAGLTRYLGAAPPPGHGRHSYFFVVHALDVPTLDLPHDASNAFLGFSMFGRTLARGAIVCWSRDEGGPARTRASDARGSSAPGRIRTCDPRMRRPTRLSAVLNRRFAGRS